MAAIVTTDRRAAATSAAATLASVQSAISRGVALVAGAVLAADEGVALSVEARRAARREIDAIARAAGDRFDEAPVAVGARALAPAIPPRFAAASLEDYAPATASQRVALAAVRRFVAEAAAGRPVMLALVGSTGAGKSHLLYGAARALVAAERRVYHRPWYRLADELRYGGPDPFAAVDPRTTAATLEPAELRRRLYGERIVLLDEIRPTSATGFDDQEIAKLALHAYDQGAAVLTTTNVSPLAAVMGPAAASRFVSVVVVGPDARQDGRPAG